MPTPPQNCPTCAAALPDKLVLSLAGRILARRQGAPTEKQRAARSANAAKASAGKRAAAEKRRQVRP